MYIYKLPRDNTIIIKMYTIFLPDIGTLSLTLSAFRILYKDKATTWGHQNMSFVSQLHVTDVILHLHVDIKKKKIHFFEIHFVKILYYTIEKSLLLKNDFSISTNSMF